MAWPSESVPRCVGGAWPCPGRSPVALTLTYATPGSGSSGDVPAAVQGEGPGAKLVSA